MFNNNELVENLSDVSHEIWSHWMKYMFSICRKTDKGDIVIDATNVKRWERQMITPYSELTEKEKASDREQAFKIIDSVNSLNSSRLPIENFLKSQLESKAIEIIQSLDIDKLRIFIQDNNTMGRYKLDKEELVGIAEKILGYEIFKAILNSKDYTSLKKGGVCTGYACCELFTHLVSFEYVRTPVTENLDKIKYSLYNQSLEYHTSHNKTFCVEKDVAKVRFIDYDSYSIVNAVKRYAGEFFKRLDVW